MRIGDASNKFRGKTERRVEERKRDALCRRLRRSVMLCHRNVPTRFNIIHSLYHRGTEYILYYVTLLSRFRDARFIFKASKVPFEFDFDVWLRQNRRFPSSSSNAIVKNLIEVFVQMKTNAHFNAYVFNIFLLYIPIYFFNILCRYIVLDREI